jgi:hypothetical protein
MDGIKELHVVRDSDDQLVNSPPARWAIGEMERALDKHGIPVLYSEKIEQIQHGGVCIVCAGKEAESAQAVLNAVENSFPNSAEALGIIPGTLGGRDVLLVCGSDVRGLVYAILEITDQIHHTDDLKSVLLPEQPVIEKPTTPIRSVARLFTSEVEDKLWFYDRSFWQRYLSMLVAQRFNRFSLTLGLGCNFPRGIRDAYFYFPYPFLLSVPGYNVTVTGLSDSERDKNLEMLKFIGEETAKRGLHFQLALWTHAYEWIDSPDANYVIEGLTADNHAAYCRDALHKLLEACPSISGVTFRVHGESGIPEKSYDFWKMVFDGIVRCGRQVEIDMHAKGLDWEMIEIALSTGMPVNVSPKYSAEHMGLPYQQASIRKQERPPRERGSNGFMSISGGSRRFLRYNYGDLLTENRRHGVLYRIWPGTQRLLLWGDPAMGAGYGRYGNFCDCLGVELCEPLSFKGRMGSGFPGGRDGYADTSLRPEGGDWEKYLYTYRLFGRLLYNPDADPESWRRFLRKEFCAAAESVEEALANASRILPLLTTAHHPSASNNAYWPEIYTNMPIVDETSSQPYGDTPSPKRFGTVSSLDPEIFSTIEEFAGELADGKLSGRYSPLKVAEWLDEFCEAAEHHLKQAEAQVPDISDPAFQRLTIDVSIQSGIGRFFALKLRSGVWYALYQRTQDIGFLDQAIESYRSARSAWRNSAEPAEGVYVDDLTFGLRPQLRGHWADRLAAIDQDLQDMEKERTERMGEQAEDRELSAEVRTLLSIASDEPMSFRCEHTPPDSFQPGSPVEIAVDPGGTGVCCIRLHYRHVNHAEEYVVADMQKQDGRYVANIPADYTDSPYPLQYFLEFRDTLGRAWLYPRLNATLSNQPYYVIRQA